MIQDLSIRVVACYDVDQCPYYKDINPSKAVYTCAHAPISDLPILSAQFGPVLAIVWTNITFPKIVIFSAEAAQRAKNYVFGKPSVHVAAYILPTLQGKAVFTQPQGPHHHRTAFWD
jgi:hypothetical protein